MTLENVEQIKNEINDLFYKIDKNKERIYNINDEMKEIVKKEMFLQAQVLVNERNDKQEYNKKAQEKINSLVKERDSLLEKVANNLNFDEFFTSCKVTQLVIYDVVNNEHATVDYLTGDETVIVFLGAERFEGKVCYLDNWCK
jgi:predicted RNase H-like nuclease (RuvC/YqgF family)